MARYRHLCQSTGPTKARTAQRTLDGYTVHVPLSENKTSEAPPGASCRRGMRRVRCGKADTQRHTQTAHSSPGTQRWPSCLCVSRSVTVLVLHRPSSPFLSCTAERLVFPSSSSFFSCTPDRCLQAKKSSRCYLGAERSSSSCVWVVKVC